ncbi:hypothetical protein Clacol_008014 [Clathrus columnatus]|uniref:Uncharacterized protein n=1 Tax=Clathrus columnatus TaxID=1419009 RepID=A0AAV5AJT5_9AGAM|nr:hypothetical protein Clacol_008014 [Clathrus columnatus]
MVMLSQEVKDRLSIAFRSIEEGLSVSRNFVVNSSIPSPKREEFLGDLSDIKKIIENRAFENIDAIQEAIITLNDVEAYCERRHRTSTSVGRFRQSVLHILQWLGYIKRTLTYEVGLVPGDIGLPERHSQGNQPNPGSPRPYFYVDDGGNAVPLGTNDYRGQHSWSYSNHP